MTQDSATRTGMPVPPDRPRALRLLLVEQGDALWEGLGRRLAERGAEVQRVGPEAAESMTARRNPDAVLLDFPAPGQGVLQLLARLRRAAPDLPVLVLSGHVGLRSAKRAMEAGAFDFLLKPVGLDELWTKLRDARELRRLSGAEDGDPAPA
ncbi:MAG: response regulator, partial [Desulfovibrionaceae bacterium]